MKRLLLPAALCLLLPCGAFALGKPRYVEASGGSGSFPIVQGKTASAIYVDAGDYAGVARAVNSLQADVARVTGVTPAITHAAGGLGNSVIIAGAIGRSALVDRLNREGKLDASGVSGQWEAFVIQVVGKPLPGVASALVIAGSDKRGTIYGIYDLSEQMGVSPWYFWADVPTVHKNALFVKAGRYAEGEPAVKYRGIFLNDEAPALSGWVKEKYGSYNHQFYETVFELILRLKGNYLWPAMWGSAFNEDDPLNPKLADEYGIVMGTTHHEPMLRAQQEWKRHGTGAWDYAKNPEILRRFWEEGVRRNKDFESIISIGMRGDGDMPMAGPSMDANVALLEKIVADQRAILAAKVNPNPAAVPQLWALYKEVQGYYEKGKRVPDDVTLLWCDDNWGNIRRLPTPEERKRSGGAGVYYHFDYVGGPRNYKWINTNPIPKVWEQMNLALQYGANRIWIVNVGDLKPMEFPIEFFLNLARDPGRWPKEKIGEFTRQSRALFQADADLTAYHNHTLAGGKWNHMMDQTHIGYTYWQEPPFNVMPVVQAIELSVIPRMGVAVEGSTAAWPGAREEAVLPDFDVFNNPRRYIDIFNRGLTPFGFAATASAPWIVLSDARGTIRKDNRLWVTVDWQRAPKGPASGTVEIAGTDEKVVVRIYAFNPETPEKATLRGFVEADGYVLMEAEHFTKKVDGQAARWERLDDYGKTLSAMTLFPVTAASVTPPRNSPCLEYEMYLFDAGKVEVEAILGPTQDFVPGRGLRYAISFDEQPPEVVDALARNSLRDWETTVKDSERKVKSTHTVKSPGYHTLKFWMVDPGVVLEKLVVNLGGVKPSYLGPPESYRAGGTRD